MQNAAAIRTVSWISRSVAPGRAGAGDALVRDLETALLDRGGDGEQGLPLPDTGAPLASART